MHILQSLFHLCQSCLTSDILQETDISSLSFSGVGLIFPDPALHTATEVSSNKSENHKHCGNHLNREQDVRKQPGGGLTENVQCKDHHI